MTQDEKIDILLKEAIQKKALEHIKSYKHITSKEYQEINNIGKVMAIRELNQLINKKILKRIGKGKNTQYIVNESLKNSTTSQSI